MMNDSPEVTPDTKMPLSSLDVSSERIEALRQLFPEAWSEDTLDTEKLQRLIGQSAPPKAERYGLSWAGKAEAHRAVQSLSTGTLRPVPEESVNFDTSENLIIEGDNLEVLKLLQKSYSHRVKMIYIDPPYNTGNEFIYPDNFREGLQTYLEYSGQVKSGVRQSTNAETNGRYHSNWLNMMYPRLFLARNLLKEDGVIFVSIDDNEVQNLRLMLNEIFGEENFLQQIVWKRHGGGGNDSRYFAVDHEYIMAVARNKESISRLRLPLSEKQKAEYTGKDEWFEKLGPFKTKSFRRMRPDDPRPGLQYGIKAPDGTKLNDEWKWEETRFLDALEVNKTFIRKDRNGNWQVEYKIYLFDHTSDEERSVVPRSLITDGDRNSDGKSQLRTAMDSNEVFSNPKPVGLIKNLMQFGCDSDGIILDFFSGSGTTAQSVLEANQADGRNRKFILVQLPEPTDNPDFASIADITKERVRRVITKMDAADNGQLPLNDEDAPNRGFKVFKLDESNFKVWDGENAPKDADALATRLFEFAEHRLVGRSSQDVLFELLLKSGRALTVPVEERQVNGQTVYVIEEGQLLIYLEEPIQEATLDAMIALAPSQVICLDAAFEGNDQLKNNIVLQMKDAGIGFRTV